MAEDAIKESITQDEAETHVYEAGFHIVPSAPEAKISSEAESIKALIKKIGGELITDESPKKINLAYTMVKDIAGKKQRFDSAYFGWIKFEMKTDSIMKVKEGMDGNKNILRFLIIKTVKESTLAPKTAVFAKDEIQKKPKPKPILKTDDKDKDKGEKITQEELDKTIEELIVK